VDGDPIRTRERGLPTPDQAILATRDADALLAGRGSGAGVATLAAMPLRGLEVDARPGAPGLLRGTGVRRHASLPTLPLPGRALTPASPATLTTAAIPIRATAGLRDTAPPADALRPAAAAAALAAGSPAAAPNAPVG